MNKIVQVLLLITLLLTVISGITYAEPYEDALAAYQRGDYATAQRLLRPLAEQGNARCAILSWCYVR